MLGDGYGVVYENNLPADKVTVTVDGKTYELNSATEITITVTDKGGTEKTYRLLPLPKELVQEVTDVPDGFYTKLTMGATGKAYYYNPHFAKTALAAEAGKPEFVSIRTARQLNNLSAYYDKYADEKVLPKNAAFQQERDIDYGTYEWAAYGQEQDAGEGAGLPSDRKKTLPLSTAMTAAVISSPAFPLPAGRTALPSACSALRRERWRTSS